VASQLSNPRLAGAVLMIGSAQFVLAMIVEQLLLVPPHYAYDPLSQTISELGNTAANSPYCLLFNVSVTLVGLLSVLGCLLLSRFAPRESGSTFGLFSLFLAGVGAIGVGLDPENVRGTVHGISAVVAFLFAGLTLIFLGRSAQTLLARRGIQISMIVAGLVDLISIGLFAGGVGGAGYTGFDERLIVIPVLAWAIVFGGMLLLGMAKHPAASAGSAPGPVPSSP
jgi:hypothetical membrane protein